MRQIGSLCVLAASILCFAQPARAQYGAGLFQSGGGTVSGTAIVNIKRQPETMRLQIALLAKGSNLKEALSALQERIEVARLQVGGLGATKNSITIGSPRIATAQNNQQRQMMERMIRQRLARSGKRPGKLPKQSMPVTVSAELTAEWKLSGETAGELLLASHELQEKIKTADLAGLKEAQKLSPEEEELLEEAQSNFGFGSGNEAKPGDPAFLFVSKISQEDRDKALTEAFKKAKSKAARLAKAAGSELGTLRSLGSQQTSAGDYNNYAMYGGYNSPAYQALQRAIATQAAGGELSEAIGAMADQVTYKITVTASFDLKKE